MRRKIKELIDTIDPYDALEEAHLADVRAWIDSGVELFRLQKPDIPPKHLVSYFVLLDKDKGQLLLIDHIKAKLLLPPGGHVEVNEHPADAVIRELQEELGIEADFINENPFFITVTQTINTDAGHTDVSLWYLLAGDASKNLGYDEREMNGYKWLSLDEVMQIQSNKLDPHMHRFISKLLRITPNL